MPLYDEAFSNSAPTSATPARGAAFNNGAPTAATVSGSAAFDNGTPTTVTQPLAGAWSNTGPTANTAGNSSAFSNSGPGTASLGALTILDTSVRAATTGNIDLTALANGSTIDGVTLATGNHVLVKNQNYIMANGVYYVGATGAATARAFTMDSPLRVFVSEGTANADKTYLYEPLRPYVPETSNVVFYAQGAAAH